MTQQTSLRKPWRQLLTPSLPRSALDRNPAPPTRGAKVGYHPTATVKQAVAVAKHRRPLVSLGMLFADHVAGYGVAVTWAMIFQALPNGRLAVLAAVPAVLLVVARSQRGLECMVHDASHRTIVERVWRVPLSRTRVSVNDAIGDWLAAMPVFSSVADFRSSHDPHHNRFAVARFVQTVGSEGLYTGSYDPDVDRATRQSWDKLEWSSRRAFAKGVALRLPCYWLDWFRSIGSDVRTSGRSVLWHFVVLAGICSVTAPVTGFLTAIVWFGAFAMVLPVLRFVGEVQEHDYQAGTTQFEMTVSNTGALNWFIHPHGDGHHVEHHCFPLVPGHQLRRLSYELAVLDPEGWAEVHKHRNTPIMRPIQAGQSRTGAS